MSKPIHRTYHTNSILCQLMEHPKKQIQVAMSGAVSASRRKRKSSTHSHTPCRMKRNWWQTRINTASMQLHQATLNRAPKCVGVELAFVLEKEEPAFVFADAKSFLCFADVYGEADSFR